VETQRQRLGVDNVITVLQRDRLTWDGNDDRWDWRKRFVD